MENQGISLQMCSCKGLEQVASTQLATSLASRIQTLGRIQQMMEIVEESKEGKAEILEKGSVLATFHYNIRSQIKLLTTVFDQANFPCYFSYEIVYDDVSLAFLESYFGMFRCSLTSCSSFAVVFLACLSVHLLILQHR